MATTAPARTTATPRVRQIVALLPAHDEEAGIGAALDSLRDQTRPPDVVVVVADNCSDATAAVARACGARVLETRGNRHRKAGALNQALELLLGGCEDAAARAVADGPFAGLEGDSLAVLVMDADCALDPRFVEVAVDALRDPGLGGVGGTFRGGPGGSLVGTFQRNEYARYERDVHRLRGRALVLTGTASLFPLAVLQEVRAARAAGRLPDHGGEGCVYDVHVLTEDNELSLALQHLGHRILAPAGCTLVTEVMPTWRALARQRLRWKRGALENLVDYGWTPVTRRYWARQLLSLLGVFATTTYLATVVYGLVVGVHLHPFWIAVTGIFALERVVTVRSRGPAQMLLASTVLVEMTFDVFLQAVQARAFVQALASTDEEW